MNGGHLGRGLIPRYLRDSQTVDESFDLQLQHRSVLELLVDSSLDQRQTQWDFFDQCKPTATRIYQCDSTDHQHEVSKPPQVPRSL
jgi:hypothetical protein